MIFKFVEVDFVGFFVLVIWLIEVWVCFWYKDWEYFFGGWIDVRMWKLVVCGFKLLWYVGWGSVKFLNVVDWDDSDGFFGIYFWYDDRDFYKLWDGVGWCIYWYFKYFSYCDICVCYCFCVGWIFEFDDYICGYFVRYVFDFKRLVRSFGLIGDFVKY